VGHLPAASRITPLTPALIGRTLLLNGIAGAVFGYLYWKRGLEAVMIAHGTADVVMHVGGPFVQRRKA
jgi:membrane protease YdiL (CAAX protease family)